MDGFLLNFIFELIFLSLLGMLYYFYQKRKLIRYAQEQNIYEEIFQFCLRETSHDSQTTLDLLIEALDKYLTKETTRPPFVLLNQYAYSPECSKDLKNLILLALEQEAANGN